MKILVIFPAIHSIPLEGYGGAERQLYQFSLHWASCGHTVDILAAVGSSPIPPGSIYPYRHFCGNSLVARLLTRLSFLFAFFVSRPSRYDVIVSGYRLDFYASLLPRQTNYVHRFPVFPVRSDIICYTSLDVCHKKAWFLTRQHSCSFPQSSDVVVFSNYVDNRLIPPSLASPRSGLCYLGLISYAKGVDRAIEIARSSGKILKIAGPRPVPGGESALLWEHIVIPAIDAGIVEYCGCLSGSDKFQFLASAEALVFPIRYPESFGSVIIESLVVGTPVLAANCYSAPEILRDGVDGYLFDSIAEAVSKTFAIASLNNQQIAENARERYSTNGLRFAGDASSILSF